MRVLRQNRQKDGVLGQGILRVPNRSIGTTQGLPESGRPLLSDETAGIKQDDGRSEQRLPGQPQKGEK